MIKSLEKPVVFKNKSMQIMGVLHKPEGFSMPPAVVFYHGCTGSKTEAHWFFVKMARALSSKGIMILRFDFRFSGESEGNFEDMTLSEEISDGFRAIEYLISDCDADPEKIGVLGLSMGGAVAAIIAGRLGNDIKSCVLLNPVGMPYEDLSTFAVSKNVSVDGFPVEFNSFLFGESFFNDLKNIKPLEEVQNAKCSFLIINGTDDKSISSLRSKEYYKTVSESSGKAELFIVQGADHVFSTVKWEKEVIEKVVKWFDTKLK